MDLDGSEQFSGENSQKLYPWSKVLPERDQKRSGRENHMVLESNTETCSKHDFSMIFVGYSSRISCDFHHRRYSAGFRGLHPMLFRGKPCAPAPSGLRSARPPSPPSRAPLPGEQLPRPCQRSSSRSTTNCPCLPPNRSTHRTSSRNKAHTRHYACRSLIGQ